MELSEIKERYGAGTERYRLLIPEIVAEASQIMFDLFNAAASGKTLIVTAIYAVPKGDVAVTGAVAIRNDIHRISAVGTGGTAATANGSDVTAATISKMDSSASALPSGITARKEPTGGATIDDWLGTAFLFSEETNAALYALQNQDILRMPVVLRQGEGLAVRQGSVASVNSYMYIADFIVV